LPSRGGLRIDLRDICGAFGNPSVGLSERKKVSHGEPKPEDIRRWVGFGSGFGFGGNPSRSAACISQKVLCEIGEKHATPRIPLEKQNMTVFCGTPMILSGGGIEVLGRKRGCFSQKLNNRSDPQ
jgi:hypothetical protein